MTSKVGWIEPSRPTNLVLFRNALTGFSVSVVLGASIPVLRQLFCGDADPFQSDWPLFLHAAACLSAFAVAWPSRQRLASAIGVYVGLVGYVLVVGKPEYPASTLIALAIHGFVPALVGSLIAFAVSRRFCKAVGWVESSRPTNLDAHAGGAR